MTQTPPAEPRGGGLGRFLQAGHALESRGVAGAAGVVALGFIGSRLLGLVRSAAIASVFGTEPELSAYWVAFRLPDLVFQVLAGATLAAAFIPTFSRVQLRSGEDAAWRLASSVLNLVAVATTLMAALAWLLAPLLVPLLAPGLGAETGREAELRTLAIELTRVMLLSPVLFGVSGMLTGILNARQHFLAPALAPMFYNLGIIAGAMLLGERFGVRGLAVGVIAGSAGHLLVQLPALRGTGMRWSPSLDLASEGVREVARLMGPRVIGLAAAQVNFVVMTFFASYVSDEAISAVNYAFLMAMLPVGVIGMAISTALFPTLAQQAATRQEQTLRATLAASLRMILFLSIPASIGLALLAEPAVVLLLQRGAFDEASTAPVTAALQLFALGIAASAAVEILSRGFYAFSDTRTPVQFAVLAMALNVALSAALVGPFGVRGLAAAGSLAAVAECAGLWFTLHRRLGGLGRRQVLRSVARTLLASVAMGQVMVLALLLLRATGTGTSSAFEALTAALVAGVAGLAAFATVAGQLRSEEYRAIATRLSDSN
jgi:putative peptidoglycan lipid II flippase